MTKTMIVYYSWSGRTAALAHQLQQLTQANTYELKVPAGTFSQDMYETSDLAKAQRRTGKLPAFTQPLPDLAGYDLILIGAQSGLGPRPRRFLAFWPAPTLAGRSWRHFTRMLAALAITKRPSSKQRGPAPQLRALKPPARPQPAPFKLG